MGIGPLALLLLPPHLMPADLRGMLRALGALSVLEDGGGSCPLVRELIEITMVRIKMSTDIDRGH